MTTEPTSAGCTQCGSPAPGDARFCPACGARLAPAATGGTLQRRHMAVMFCDIVGSTQLAERLDPEDFHEILAEYQHACSRAIERVDGHAARFIGDGVLAYFGYPRAYEDYAQRAVLAGLDILGELTDVNIRLGATRGLALKVRIAVHTGLVLVGQMGPDTTRAEIDIVGETPHLASRLQATAPPDAIVISDATAALVDGYFQLQALGQVDLKGISRPVAVHRVLAPTGAVGRLQAAGSRRLTPLIGRDHELAALSAAWSSVKRGRGAVVHLRGEAGIGKSRLARELRARISRELGAIQCWQCSAHHRTTSLHPVIQALEQLVELDRTAPAARQTARVYDAALSAGIEPIPATAVLSDLLALPGAPPRELAPREARLATLQALEAVLVANPSRHPLLLLVEDLHWADASTVELLGRIIARLDELPVLCVMTFRPEFRPPWAPVSTLDLDLARLDTRHVRALAGAVSGGALDEATLARVQSACDGVPLFVEELVRMLAFERPTGTQIAETVPSTLRGLLTERLDRLPECAGVIDVAAVLGREFDRPLLAELGLFTAPELDLALAELAAQDVIRPVAGSRSRCEFSHALLQEAAYERVLLRRRATLHRQVAESLVGGFATVAEREPEVVAHHFSFAQEPARAVGYWHSAGTRALERAAFQEAAEHFRRGLEALDAAGADHIDELDRVDFMTHRAAAMQAGHGYAADGVGRLYAAARQASAAPHQRHRLAAVIRGEWMLQLLRGEYAAALQLADEMLALDLPADDSLAEGHLYSGLAHAYLAHFTLAEDHLEQAIAHHRRPQRPDQIYEAQGDTGVGARAYLAMVQWNLGRCAAAQTRSDESLALAKTVGGPVTRAQTWFMRSILHFARGEPIEFSQWIARTRAYSVEGNIGYWRTSSALFDGWRVGRSGDLAGGIAQVQNALGEYLASGSRLSLPHFMLLLADLRLIAGDKPGALDALRQGDEYITRTGERFSEAELLGFMGRTLMADPAPDPAAADDAYLRAVQSASGQGASLLELRALTALCTHRRGHGEPGDERERLQRLCERFAGEPAYPDLVRARAVAQRAQA